MTSLPSDPSAMARNRREFLAGAGLIGLSAAGLWGVAGCSDEGAGGFKATATPSKPAAAGKLRGRVVVATLQNPPKQAQEALTKAYQRLQPGVEVIWETKNYGNVGDYTSWLGTQLAADRVRPDIVSGNYVPTFGNYVNFDEYAGQTNPYTGNAWREDYRLDLYRELNTQGERYLIGTEGVHLYCLAPG